MFDWIDTVLALATGWTLGVMLTRLYFRAQLGACRQLIAQHLTAATAALSGRALQPVPILARNPREHR